MEIPVVFKWAVGIFFVLHGIVFLIWGPTYWKVYTLEGLPYATSVLWRRVNVGDAGVRIVGLLWLLSGGGWILVGIGLIFATSWWLGLTVATALFSSIPCILALPEAKYDLVIDLVILRLVYLNGVYAWL